MLKRSERCIEPRLQILHHALEAHVGAVHAGLVQTCVQKRARVPRHADHCSDRLNYCLVDLGADIGVGLLNVLASILGRIVGSVLKRGHLKLDWAGSGSVLFSDLLLGLRSVLGLHLLGLLRGRRHLHHLDVFVLE